jgi:hypothetical protein
MILLKIARFDEVPIWVWIMLFLCLVGAVLLTINLLRTEKGEWELPNDKHGQDPS